jgi:hypothetical protein
MYGTGNEARRAGTLTLVVGTMLAAALVLAMTATGARGCPVCGKNLIKNPGADAGLGVTAVDARGAVPGWEIAAGQFGAASYAFPNGWFAARSKGPAKRGKNYFFGGTTREAVEARASIGKQTIKLPASAVGRKATLSGWLGNYGENRAQVRAEFMDESGKVLSTIRIGPDVTIAGTDMAARSRSRTVPAKSTQVTIVVIFSGGGTNYKLAGADSLSLVLT